MITRTFSRFVSQLHHNVNLSLTSALPRWRANRIICTIGPSTQSVEALKGLMTNGMSVARMNFSHGSYEYHKATIDNVRTAAAELGLNIAIALDTKGPEIRTGTFVGGEAVMERGATCYVTTDPEFADKGTKQKFYIDYARLPHVVRPGGYVYIDDGILILSVQSREDEHTLKCVVANAHVISDRRGVNLPGCDVDLPAVSEKDRADLKFGVEQGVDMVFASFIRTSEQVEEVRGAVKFSDHRMMVVSKIENHQGVRNIDAIIDKSDGIMVARGDLGVGIAIEKITIAQKHIIAKCNVAGKPVICATQMLESMTYNPRPTRAEVSDVANAVLDGADCVMLSGETAKGKYPNEVVQYMARICLEAQSAVNDFVRFQSIMQLQRIPMCVEEAVCSSAVSTSYETEAKAIVVLSYSGRIAKLVAKYCPKCPVILVTSCLRTCREVALTRGIECCYFDPRAREDSLGDLDALLAAGVEYAHTVVCMASGDRVVAVLSDKKFSESPNQSRILIVE